MADRLSLAEAKELLEGATQRAEGYGFRLSIALVDTAGHLVALHRMDGAGFLTPQIATGKAYTASAWGIPSAALAERVKHNPMFATAISAMTGGRFTPQIGGLPVRRNEQLLGGVGASGASGEEDEQVLREALEALGYQTG